MFKPDSLRSFAMVFLAAFFDVKMKENKGIKNECNFIGSNKKSG